MYCISIKLVNDNLGPLVKRLREGMDIQEVRGSLEERQNHELLMVLQEEQNAENARDQ